MHTTNYTQTLILPSPDSKAMSARVPDKSGSVAALQHQRLASSPYGSTSDELIFSVHAERQAIPADQRDAKRAEFFSKGQACLRASPLVKSFGWALHHNEQGRVALVDPASPLFAELLDREDITKLNGMRSSRA